MDSRKSGEEGLKKNYGVIRLGIGEDNIASDDDCSFGSDTDFEDEEELLQRQATKQIKEEIEAEEAAVGNEKAESDDGSMYNSESFNILSKLMQAGIRDKMRRNRPSTKMTKDAFAQAQTQVDELRSQFLTSVKTRRRVELGLDRKRSTCSKMSTMDMIDASSSAIGDQD